MQTVEKILTKLLSTSAAKCSSHKDCSLVNELLAYNKQPQYLSKLDDPQADMYADETESCFLSSGMTILLENKNLVGMPFIFA